MSEINIKENISLAPMTTFKIGGSAKFFIEVATKEELSSAIDWAKEKNEKFYILAGGSNVLINDNGVNGLVIKINNQEISVNGNDIECGAGVNLATVVRRATGHGLSGLEWAVGIPGTIGGAVRGNAGAFGYSIGDSIVEVEIYDTEKGGFYIISKDSCGFGYRHSIFKDVDWDGKNIIWSVKIALKDGAAQGVSPEEYLNRRLSSQPKLPSAGSVFKNLKLEEVRQSNNLLAEKAEEDGVVKNGMVAAGWIIELLGIKGKTIGGAKVSLEHANFIVNSSNAKAGDVIMLISYIKQQVRDKFKIQLQEEIQYFGF